MRSERGMPLLDHAPPTRPRTRCRADMPPAAQTDRPRFVFRHSEWLQREKAEDARKLRERRAVQEALLNEYNGAHRVENDAKAKAARDKKTQARRKARPLRGDDVVVT